MGEGTRDDHLSVTLHDADLAVANFVYYPSFIAQIINSTEAFIWLAHPAIEQINYDSSKAVPINIKECPSKQTDWTKLQVDDYMNSENSGYTSLGPLFPHCHTGTGVHISTTYRSALQADVKSGAKYYIPDHVQAASSPRQLLSLAVRRGKTITKYHEFKISNDFGVLSNGDRLLAISHATTTSSIRAPRVVRVPPGVIARDAWIDVDFTAQQARDPATSIFLEKGFARAVNIEVSKLPGGSGHWVPPGVRMASASIATSSASAAASSISENLLPDELTDSLNVFGHDADADIFQIVSENRIKISKGESLSKALGEYAKSEKQHRRLDLIGHTRSSDGALLLGGLPLTPPVIKEVFTPEAVASIKKMQICEIRLLGCRTAIGDMKLDVGKEIRTRMGSPSNFAIYTTRADIFAAHYSKTGFIAQELLIADRFHPGDLPPQEDEPKSNTQTIFRVNPGERPARPADLPSADNITALPTESDGYRAWLNAEAHFSLFLDATDSTAVVDSPVEAADYQVFVVDNDNIRAFEILLRSVRRRIRISYKDRWLSFMFSTNTSAVNSLLMELKIPPVAASNMTSPTT